MGYHRAGFDVVGVDVVYQKRYPFEFIHMDALEYLRRYGRNYDAIHASPPCQKYTVMRSMPNAKRDHPDLIGPTRELLIETGKPYVIENVVGSPLINPVMLCGTMFGLGVKAARAELRRHRLFECSWFWLNPLTCKHSAILTIGVCGDHGNGPNARERMSRLIDAGVISRPTRPRTVGVWGNAGGASVRDGVQQFNTKERAEAMGIDWMTGAELSEAIPPAYTLFIGERLIDHLTALSSTAAPEAPPAPASSDP